jgi:uncharacterized protein YjiS (DUF1127 family)
MHEQKRTVQVARARSRVKTLGETAAPWTSQERARRQLRRIEAKNTRPVKE